MGEFVRYWWLNEGERSRMPLPSSAGSLVLKGQPQDYQSLPLVSSEVVRFWEQLRERTSQTIQRNAQNFQAQRVQAVLGYPALRTLVDRDGQVVVQLGELISPRTVERARQSGQLEQLLAVAHRHGDREPLPCTGHTAAEPHSTAEGLAPRNQSAS